MVDQNSNVLYPESAESRMRNTFAATELRTEDFGDWTTDDNAICPDEDEYIGPGYTTEEWEIDGTGKQNCIDLCEDSE